MRILLAMVAAMIGYVPQPASAQDSRWYAGGSAFISTQDSHRQGTAPSLPLTGVGGTTVGAAAEAGARLSRHLGVGVEFTLPARIESVQETRYTRVFQVLNRYRDVTLSGVARISTSRLGPAMISAVGGAGLVHESSLQRRRDALSPFIDVDSGFGPYGDEVDVTRWTFGIVFGGEVDVAVSRHLSIVPGTRIEWVRRSQDAGQGIWFLGLASVVVRPGIGLRATF